MSFLALLRFSNLAKSVASAILITTNKSIFTGQNCLNFFVLRGWLLVLFFDIDSKSLVHVFEIVHASLFSILNYYIMDFQFQS